MKYITKTGSPPGFIALLVGALLLGLVSQGALALGTVAGTSISNQATLSYSVSTVAQTPITSAAAAFVVDAKINELAAGGAITTPVSPGQLNVVTPFTVTNTSNVTLNFLLTAQNNSNGTYTVLTPNDVVDNFDPATALTIYLDNGAGGGTACDGILNGTEGAAAITSIQDLAPGPTVCLLVKTDIPAARVNGDAMVISFKAQAAWPTTLIPAEEPPAGGGAGQMGGSGVAVTASAGADTPGTIDVVLADGAGVAADAGAGITVDNASDGYHSTYGAFRVSSAVLSVAKLATVICDPINGDSNPKNIPGAAVQYAVTITNAAGGASATLSQITDALNAALTFDPGLISGTGAGTNCVAGTGNQSASGFGAVNGAGVVTSYAAPGSAAQAVTAGASVAGQNVTIDFSTLVGGAYSLVGGVLPANSFVTVYFNAFVQ